MSTKGMSFRRTLPGEPLRDFVERACRARQMTHRDIAHAMGAKQFHVCFWDPEISIYFIDRVATALGSHPVLIYGDDWLNVPNARCTKGHELTEDNVYRSNRYGEGRSPQESCKICKDISNREVKRRRKDAAA